MQAFLSAVAASVLVLGTATVANASAIHFDLSSDSSHFVSETPGDGSRGEGNVLNYASSGVNLSVSSYTLLGSDTTFSDSDTRSFRSGLGVCNTIELSGSCGTGPHTMDNRGSRDVLVFVFDHVIDFTSVTIGYVGSDADIDWLVGLGGLDLDLEGLSLAGLGASLAIDASGSNEGNTTRSAAISGVGNVLIVAAQLTESNDEIKIKAVRGEVLAPVPLPPAAVLLFSALAPLLRRRRV